MASNASIGEVSTILRAWSEGDQSAFERLTPIVHDELHRLARRYMRQERPGHTLQTSALVNEAYMRLVDYKRMEWQNRAHFFAVSAQVMRRILVDHARRRNLKRGGGLRHVSLQVVELRYFGGLSVEETAAVLKVSPVTVMRDWSSAKAWLYRELTDAPAAPSVRGGVVTGGGKGNEP
jgi:RNA polymerase sigma-70 factor, ECF subfamily